MKKIFIVTLLSLCVSSLFAQRDDEKWYLNGLGFRLEVGADSDNLMGVEYNHFFRQRFDITALYISNWDFSSSCIYEGAIMAKYVASYPNLSSRLRWYAGGGIECMGQSLRDYDGKTKTGEVRVLFGPTVVIGTGYSLKKIPINATVEWRPSLYLAHKNRSINDTAEKFAIFAFTISYITSNRY